MRRIPLRSIPSWAYGLLGLVAIVALWWLWSALTPARGSYSPVPSPLAVVQRIAEDGFGYYWPSFQVTLTEAGIGYLWGNGIALLLCAIVLVVPRLEGVLNQVAVISYCLPLVAIGPLLVLILGGAEERGTTSSTAIFFAALSCVFTTIVSALLGLKAADRAALDVVYVYGGSRVTQLLKVRLIAALPNVLSGLQIAVPAAFLGAILGEYMGRIQQSVSVLLIASQVNLNSERIWALFVLCALVAIVGYLVVGLLARLATSWSRGAAR